MSQFDLSRRSFLGGVAGFCAAAPFGLKGIVQGQDRVACRSRVPNPWVENGKPVVAVVRGTSFPAMLARGMEMLGGFAPFGADRAVMLKPNFITPSPYPETTDGPSILAVIEAMRRDGFGDFTIGEWGLANRQMTEVFDFYNLTDMAGPGSFGLRNLFGDEIVIAEDDRWASMPMVRIFETAYRAPLIVNMPVIKQHLASGFSCALKNNMGPIDIVSRMAMHRRYRRGLDAETLLRESKLAVAEIAAALNPEITVIDARKVMGVQHMLRIGGIEIEANRLIVSGDQVAADRVAAQVLDECFDGFQASMVSETLDHAAALGLGAASPDEVVLKEAEA